jgi:hypothetical protein
LVVIIKKISNALPIPVSRKGRGLLFNLFPSPSLEEEGEVTKSIIQHHRPLRETVMENEYIIIFPSLSLEEDGDDL